jgi:hypothetical protein
MLTLPSDGWRLLALAVIFTTLVGAWMFRYEHVLRGAICPIHEECWFKSSW